MSICTSCNSLLMRLPHPAARTVEIAGDIEPAQQRNRFLVPTRGPNLLSVQNSGPLGVDENVGEFLDVVGITDRFGRSPIFSGLRYDGLGNFYFPAQHITRTF